MNKTNDLLDFMGSLKTQINDEYNRIQKRSTEDPGTAGDQGEENWATIFRNWLPADYQVVTKGRLLSENGTAGPQLDVIILKPFYPRHLIDKKLYLTAGVIAAFECKNTLKSADIKKSIETAKQIRQLIEFPRVDSNYQKELYSPIIYGLICHSHSWKSKHSNPIDVIERNLKKYDIQISEHPRECLDFICVSDLAVWTNFKSPKKLECYHKNGKDYARWIDVVQTAFWRSSKDLYKGNPDTKASFTPIGTFLSNLFGKLALRDKRLMEFSRYFSTVIGSSSCYENRDWPDSTLSQTAKNDLKINADVYWKNGYIIPG